MTVPYLSLISLSKSHQGFSSIKYFISLILDSSKLGFALILSGPGCLVQKYDNFKACRRLAKISIHEASSPGSVASGLVSTPIVLSPFGSTSLASDEAPWFS